MRANATLLFTEAFPIHDPDQSNQNIDETIQKQLDAAMVRDSEAAQILFYLKKGNLVKNIKIINHLCVILRAFSKTPTPLYAPMPPWGSVRSLRSAGSSSLLQSSQTS